MHFHKFISINKIGVSLKSKIIQYLKYCFRRVINISDLFFFFCHFKTGNGNLQFGVPGSPSMIMKAIVKKCKILILSEYTF